MSIHHPSVSHPSSNGAMLAGFDYQPTTRLVFGVGAVDRLGVIAKDLGGRRALVVTDAGIRAAGHVDRGLASLQAEGVETAVFDGVEENPTTRHVDACVAAARRENIDLLIGFGGGSSMDTAKGANFILSNGGSIADYWGVDKAAKPMLPMIAIPTTAGTGSEAQSFALIADDKTHQKMACGDKKAACRAAILDPHVTVSQPARVTAVVGMDAIAHALESFVCRKRNALSCLFALNAWRLLAPNYRRVLTSPEDVEARGAMLLGANFSGAAIEHSMLGATHSLANPLTAHFGVTHGVAVGVMLPWVVRFNAATCDALYAELLGETEIAGAGDRLADRLTEMLALAGMPRRLAECDVPTSALAKLAADAVKQWTAQYNPRHAGVEEMHRLYAAAV